MYPDPLPSNSSPTPHQFNSQLFFLDALGPRGASCVEEVIGHQSGQCFSRCIPEESRCPSPSSHPLPMASQPETGALSPSPIGLGFYLSWSCVVTAAVSSCVLWPCHVKQILLPCRCQLLPAYRLSVSHPTVVPEPLVEGQGDTDIPLRDYNCKASLVS